MSVEMDGHTVEVVDPLGSVAQDTIETFILNQLQAAAEAALGFSPITEDHITGASLKWEDDGQGGKQVKLSVRFEVAGTWTPA